MTVNPWKWFRVQSAGIAQMASDEKEVRDIIDHITTTIADGSTHPTEDFSAWGSIGNMWVALGRLQTEGKIDFTWEAHPDTGVQYRLWRKP